MQHQYGLEKIVIFIISAVMGMIKYMGNPLLLLFIDTKIIAKLFEAGATAFVCGVLGLAGRDIYNKAKRWWTNRKNKK